MMEPIASRLMIERTYTTKPNERWTTKDGFVA